MSERPDPFVFPDGVKFRFVLLVTALLATSAFVYNLLYYAVAPGADDAVADYQRCIAAPPEVAPVTDPGAYARGSSPAPRPWSSRRPGGSWRA